MEHSEYPDLTAAVPPMPWLSTRSPAAPGVGATLKGAETVIQWQADGSAAKIAIQARSGGSWRTVRIAPAGAGGVRIPKADAIAVSAIDRFGATSTPKVLGLR